jgi:alcohol dehydrogenase (NADP+)
MLSTSSDSIIISPESVPTFKLASGSAIPAIGLGTFGSDNYSSAQIAEAVYDAAVVGYRHFDCASIYGNEAEIGESLSKITKDVARREEIWVTSKVWNDKHGCGEVIESCKKSLRNLRLDYLDLFLVHWPFPNHHAKGVDVSSRDPHARPYIHDEYMQAWAQMEQLHDEGLVRHIGTSNMTVPKLELVLKDARVRPSANEMEMHPHFQQPDLLKYVQSKNILPIAYSPIGSPSRPERDRVPTDTVDIEDPVIVRIASDLGVHPVSICLKWAVQRGTVPIPFSVKPTQFRSNLLAVTTQALSAEQMAAIASIDKNNRLIKGQVFLWEGADDWHSLWDEDGNIAK